MKTLVLVLIVLLLGFVLTVGAGMGQPDGREVDPAEPGLPAWLADRVAGWLSPLSPGLPLNHVRIRSGAGWSYDPESGVLQAGDGAAGRCELAVRNDPEEREVRSARLEVLHASDELEILYLDRGQRSGSEDDLVQRVRQGAVLDLAAGARGGTLRVDASNPCRIAFLVED